MGKKIDSTACNDEILRIQKNISVYLRSYRQINEITRNELLDDLGCSLATLEKYEHPSKPSPIANYIVGLKPLADLRGLDLDVFVSGIIGKANEEGESNAFIKQTSEKIEALNARTQYKIHELLQMSEEDINDVLDLRAGIVSHPKRVRNALKGFLNKSGKWFDSVINIIIGDEK